MKPEDIFTINTTLKLRGDSMIPFEDWLVNNFEVISFRIVPDTTKLYEDDNMFKKLVKIEKDARVVKEKYINDKNNL